MNNSRTVYVNILDERAREIGKQIREVERTISNMKKATGSLEVKLMSLKNEYKKIEAEKEEYNQTRINKYDNYFSINVLDVAHDKTTAKKEKLEQEIRELNELKNQLKTNRAINKSAKKIAKKQEIVRNLQNRTTKIGKVQRNIIMSKRVILNMKNKAFSKQEARIEYLDNKINDKMTLRDSLNPENSIKDRIIDNIYDIQEQHYINKKEREEAILMEMKNRKVITIGTRAIVMSKMAINKLKTGINSMKNQLNEMFEKNEELEDENTQQTRL